MNEKTYLYESSFLNQKELVKATKVPLPRLRELIKKSEEETRTLEVLVILFHHDRKCTGTTVFSLPKVKCLTRDCDFSFRKLSDGHRYCSRCQLKQSRIHVTAMEERLYG